MLSFKGKKRKGFTLIELIVVMAVLAVLVALGAPRFLGYTKDAKVTAMKNDSAILEQASMQYTLNNNNELPVGANVNVADTAVVDAEVLPVIGKELKNANATLTDAQITALVTALNTANAFKEVDKADINQYVKSTKNSVGSYFIVDSVTGVTNYNNELEGRIFSKKAIEDSKGTYHSGKLE